MTTLPADKLYSVTTKLKILTKLLNYLETSRYQLLCQQLHQGITNLKADRTALIFNSVVTGHILSARSVLFALKFVMSKLWAFRFVSFDENYFVSSRYNSQPYASPDRRLQIKIDLFFFFKKAGQESQLCLCAVFDLRLH